MFNKAVSALMKTVHLLEGYTTEVAEWDSNYELQQMKSSEAKKNKFVRPRWPYDMRPSARAEKYIRDAGP